jgi:hypothetical protein
MILWFANRPTWMRRWNAGLCPCCENPRYLGRRRCLACLRKDAARSRQRYPQIKARGVCLKCGKKPRKGMLMCGRCAEAWNAPRRKGKGRATV